MSANLIYLLFLSIFAVVVFLLASASIQWGLKRAAIAEVSLLKGFGLYLLFSLVGGLAAGLVTIVFMVMSTNLSETTLDIMGYAVALASPAFLVTRIGLVEQLLHIDMTAASCRNSLWNQRACIYNLL